MKKIFTLLVAAISSMSMMAKDYTCPLTVVIDGASTDCGNVTVTIDQQSDGDYSLQLKNFALEGMAIGTINVEGVEGISCANTTVINTAQIINITEGDDENVFLWMGPLLGDVPITLLGELKGDDIKAVLNISFMGMVINVKLGNGTESLGQLPNAGFSNYHTATYSSSTSQEPNGWHSFMTATGSMVAAVAGTPHTFVADECSPYCTDQKSVQIKSGVVYGQSANGTITTGRLQAGSIFATNADNCSFADLTKTDIDSNNDPFYTILTQKPDSIKAWVKLHNGPRISSNAKYVYATISAIINDGTYVQDPEKTDYESSIIARAKNAEIASNDEQWQEISIPFVYTESTAQPKSILVTMSTCAQAAGGSRSDEDPDVLTVDSVALVYNYSLESLKIKGQDITFNEEHQAEVEVNGEIGLNDIEFTTNAEGAYYSEYISTEDADGEKLTNPILTIIITSGDLKNANTYAVTLKGATATGITHAQTAPVQTSATEIYNAAGQQTNALQHGLNIIKQGDKVVKVIKK